MMAKHVLEKVIISTAIYNIIIHSIMQNYYLFSTPSSFPLVRISPQLGLEDSGEGS